MREAISNNIIGKSNTYYPDMKLDNKPMTVVDLFSGCGGFSAGFHLANFEIKCAIDHWETARKSITMNHGKNIIPEAGAKYNYDVEAISKLPDYEFDKIIPDTDIIIGSPPCVSFSNSNKSGSADKELSIRLIESFMRIIARKMHKPNSILKYWIMENVPKSEKYIENEYVFDPYDKLRKYSNQKNCLKIKVENREVFDMSDYGVPSRRKRFFCGKFKYPDKNLNIGSDELKLKNILESLDLTRGKIKIKDPVWSELSLNINNITDHDYFFEIPEWRWKIAKRQKRDKGYMGKMSFPENLDSIARTIVAFGASQSREAFILPHKFNRYRNATIREYATLMSFPINYQFAGVSHAIKKKQIGNAVSPKFSFELAKAISGIKNPNKHKLKTNVNLNGYFVNLNNQIFEIPSEPKKRFNVIFDQHIPYLNIYGFRSVLNNRNSDWVKRKIKWDVSIHKGAGNYKIFKPSIVFCKNYFHLTKSELNAIKVFKSKKGTALTLHNSYRETLSNRREKKILGPEELLAEVKKKVISPRYNDKVETFENLEKHNPESYKSIIFKNTKDQIEYQIPEPILLGYYVLKMIFTN